MDIIICSYWKSSYKINSNTIKFNLLGLYDYFQVCLRICSNQTLNQNKSSYDRTNWMLSICSHFDRNFWHETIRIIFCFSYLWCDNVSNVWTFVCVSFIIWSWDQNRISIKLFDVWRIRLRNSIHVYRVFDGHLHSNNVVLLNNDDRNYAVLGMPAGNKHTAVCSWTKKIINAIKFTTFDWVIRYWINKENRKGIES